MVQNHSQGKLIVIDGIDGAGKSTQARMLLEALELSQIPSAFLKFPQYGSRTGGMVEAYLQGEFKSITPRAAAILYTIDRFDAAERIRALLAEGKIVVCDRYTFANAAHQGGKFLLKEERIQFFKWLDSLEYDIFNIPKPDLNVILDTSETVAHKNLRKSGKKLDKHELSMDHLEKSRKTYLELVALLPNSKLVKCTQNSGMLDPDEIHNQVWQLVRRVVLRERAALVMPKL